MALTDTFKPNSTCSGVVEGFGGLPEVVDRIEEFLRKTLPQLLVAISPVRQNSAKLRNEKDLCAELGKRLNFAAYGELFSFYPEDPENESNTRTLDYGAYPRIHFVIGSRLLGATDRLYGLEAKRLPTHTSPINQPEREREYVVGHWNLRTSNSKRISGGIERFKEGLHGASLERVGMIAFVQKHDSKHWLAEINRSLLQCTLAGNQSTTDRGGAIAVRNNLSVVQCTISGNSASIDSGGIRQDVGALTIQNSIVGGNIANTPADIYIGSTLIRVGANLVHSFGSDGGASLSGPDFNFANPLLGPLDDWGGPTRTMPLLLGSPARYGAFFSLVSTDQRGFDSSAARPTWVPTKPAPPPSTRSGSTKTCLPAPP